MNTITIPPTTLKFPEWANHKSIEDFRYHHDLAHYFHVVYIVAGNRPRVIDDTLETFASILVCALDLGLDWLEVEHEALYDGTSDFPKRIMRCGDPG